MVLVALAWCVGMTLLILGAGCGGADGPCPPSFDLGKTLVASATVIFVALLGLRVVIAIRESRHR
jgi:hypothetical protein